MKFRLRKFAGIFLLVNFKDRKATVSCQSKPKNYEKKEWLPRIKLSYFGVLGAGKNDPILRQRKTLI